MRFIYYFFMFRLFMQYPILTLGVLIFAYILIDKKFLGFLPSFTRPFKRKRRIRAIKEELGLNPYNIELYRELGQMYLEQKKYKDSIVCFEKTLEKMGSYAETNFYLGKAYFLSGKKEEGVEFLRKAISINPKVSYGEVYFYLLEYELSRDSKDEKSLEIILDDLNQYGVIEYLYKSGKLLKNKYPERAKEFFQEAISLYSVSPKYIKRKNRKWLFFSHLNK